MKRVLGLLLALSVALPAAVKPKFPATEVFDKVLAAEENLAWAQADIIKSHNELQQAKFDAMHPQSTRPQ